MGDSKRRQLARIHVVHPLLRADHGSVLDEGGILTDDELMALQQEYG